MLPPFSSYFDPERNGHIHQDAVLSLAKLAAQQMLARVQEHAKNGISPDCLVLTVYEDDSLFRALRPQDAQILTAEEHALAMAIAAREVSGILFAPVRLVQITKRAYTAFLVASKRQDSPESRALFAQIVPQGKPVEERLMEEVCGGYPLLSENVEQFYFANGNGLPAWDKSVFLPFAAWLSIDANKFGTCAQPTLENLRSAQALSVLGTWRYCRNVYEIPPALLRALHESDVEGDIPVEVLRRLPAPCVYVKTPGFRFGNEPIEGFFALFDQDVERGGGLEIRIALVHANSDIFGGLDNALDVYPVPLVGTIADGFGSLKAPQISAEIRAQAAQAFAREISKFISVLLYLCSEGAEIAAVKGDSVSVPAPKKVKRGMRLFPAPKTVFFEVGAAIAQKLENEAQNAEKTQGGGQAGESTKRPHLRRGHWHGYWIGARGSAARKLTLKWLQPVFVHADKD